MIGADVDAVSDAVAPGLALLAHAVAANAMSTNMPRTRTRRGVASARHRVACTVSPTRRPTRPHSANCRPPSLPLNHQLTDRIPDTWTAELDLLAERIRGAQRWYTEPVRSPAGWLRTRLADWLDTGPREWTHSSVVMPEESAGDQDIRVDGVRLLTWRQIVAVSYTHLTLPTKRIV